jgi:hypothetical protein
MVAAGPLEVSSDAIYHSILEPSFNFSVGGLVRLTRWRVGAWIAQRHQNRRDLLTKKIFHREQLYSDFIRETAPAIADAIQHALHDPSKLIPIYALLSRIRLSSSSNVIASAERVVQSVLSTYSEPNLTNLARRASGLD